jgi:glycerate 2-kinase
MVEGRRIVLDIIDETLRQVNYYNIIKRMASTNNGVFKIGDVELDLAEFRNIYLVGGGKCVSFMAQALEEILGDRIKSGVIVEKKGSSPRQTRIPIILGGHPLPDEDSIRGALEIVKTARLAGESDLLIVCVSGGWTALASAPPFGISLQEFRVTYELLLRSGMTLTQMNTVRYHLSQLGKGKVPMLTDRATVLGLIASDEVGGRPWGPTVTDPCSFSDATRVLRRFDLLPLVPTTVRDYLEAGDAKEETPKPDDYVRRGVKVRNIVIADNAAMCEAASRATAKLGLSSHILTTTFEGEAKHVGTVVASLANEISMFNRPFQPPCVVIAGGETTVTITGEAGEGGRNQELALSAALSIPNGSRVTIASIGTDGTDGPTDIAGALVDGTTMRRAADARIDVLGELKKHNSSFVLRKLRDAIFTHDTGTNLMDLVVIYVVDARLKQKAPESITEDPKVLSAEPMCYLVGKQTRA